MLKSSCGCRHNQTHQECFQALKKTPSEKGTGLFGVPAPDNGILEWRIIKVRDLSYRECLKRGANCVAFQWVANSVKSFDDLSKTVCTDSCPGGDCDQVGCTCMNTECYEPDQK